MLLQMPDNIDTTYCSIQHTAAYNILQHKTYCRMQHTAAYDRLQHTTDCSIALQFFSPLFFSSDEARDGTQAPQSVVCVCVCVCVRERERERESASERECVWCVCEWCVCVRASM